MSDDSREPAEEGETAASSRRFRMPSLSVQVFGALGLGLLAGIFFGERMVVVAPIGDVFISLLQMAVWPYIVVSLIGGLGRLSYGQAVSLGVRGGAFLLLFWGIAVLAVVAVAVTFPTWTTATFFTSSLAEEAGKFDFIGLYIPTNPFASLANSVLPAVVLFSVVMGIALIPMEEKKQPVLALLDALTEALMGIASFVSRLAPLGVFALVGVAAGTMRVEELIRLQVYIYSYVTLSLLLSFWIVPGLVTVLLPISYRELMRSAQTALITAFATGSLLVALPLVAEGVKKAMAEVGTRSRDAQSAVDVVVPINFTLPNLGKLLGLAFVPFAGWLTGFEMSPDQYPVLLVSGLFSMFAEVVALPFLLDLMRIPADTFQLFVALDVSTGRFGQMLAGAHTFALALLIGGAVAGLLELRRAAMIRYVLITSLLLIVSVGGLRLLYEYGLPSEYEQDERFRSMDLAAEPVALTVLEKLPRGDAISGASRLDQVVARGVLRVGYLADSLPNVFVNSESELVGLDVDLASLMARDMGVDLEFARVSSLDEAGAALDAGSIDIMMSGLSVTPGRMLDMHFSEPYMRATMSFVVRDHVRAKFSSREAVQALKKPKIGVLDTPYYIETLRSYLPQAEVVKLGSPGDFFRQRSEELDALFLTAERGSAWTLLYPEFSVAVPQPDVLAAPVAIGVARSADALADFINGWLRMKREDRTLDQLYEYWILGAGAEPTQPRWSVIRDVLGWVD
jgi:Na+/H+-dicarboxylate symporter/ABC-type amino acid transport substrate-binding protein